MTKNKSSETKEILANTLFDLLERKPFPKISVNELCENSMIVRSTFYLHFQDKYELLSYCLDRISMELEEDNIQVVYFVTNSEEAFREMTAGVKANNTYQLYRDYIDNFVLGSRRDS